MTEEGRPLFDFHLGRLRTRPVALEAAQQALHPLLHPPGNRVSRRSGQTGGQTGRPSVQTFLVTKLTKAHKHKWLQKLCFTVNYTES